MKTQDSASAYNQYTGLGATAVGQVIALYDAVLRDLHRAVEALDAGKIEERVNRSNHALIVIGELQGVLDFERGGEPARRLNSFYHVTRAIIAQASISSSRQQFQQAIGMFARLRGAWSQVERAVAPSAPHKEFRISHRQAVLPQGPAETVEVSSESRPGGWEA